VRLAAVFLSAVVFAGIVVAELLRLPTPAVNLPASVGERIHESGVAHPVTAVLLNFRGYDTLLEIGVLLLAAVIVLAVQGDEPARKPAVPPPAEPPIQMFARIAMGPMTVVAVYLLWAGAYRPGGAFQAGAVLAAMAVLLHLAGVTRNWARPVGVLRAGLTGGLLLFIGVAGALLTQGFLLQYPLQHAGPLILLIEAGLTLSLGLVLASLFLFLAPDQP
jgi:multisubunit Na+/H+ antiporter MnhB subunit